MKLKLWYGFILFIGCFHLQAQSPSVFMECLTIEDGLLNNKVLQIAQDSTGFLWLVTNDGISRYDGSDFKHYINRELTGPGFPETSSMRIYSDRMGGIWTATAAGAVLSFDPLADKFIIRNDSSTRIPAQAISFYQDSLSNFWIGTLNGGLCYWDRHENTLRTHRMFNHPDSLPDNLITDISPGADPGILTISTTKGNCLLSIADQKFYRLWYNSENPEDNYKHNVIRDFMETDDSFYAGTYGGLHVTSKEDYSIRHYYSSGTTGKSLNYNSVWAMVEDENGAIWIATYGGGINIFDPGTGEFTYLTRENSPLPENNTMGLFLDKDGSIWVMTDNTGIVKIDARKRWIRRFTHEQLEIDGILSVHLPSDSVIWIGANGGGLVRLNLTTGFADHYIHDPSDNRSIGYNHVSGVSSDKDGNLWISLAGGGLNYFDVSEGRFYHYLFEAGSNSISNNALSTVVVTDSVVWYGTYGSGYGTYNPETGIFTNYIFPKSSFDEYMEVNNIFVDSSGNVWILTDSGVIVYDREQGEFVDLLNSSKPEMPVTSFFFTSIAESSTGKFLLLNNTNKLVEVEYRGKSSVIFSQVSLPADLNPNFKFREIIHFSDDELWLAGQREIIRISDDGTIHSFDQKDGFFGTEFYVIHRSGSSSDVVSSDGGLNIFDIQGLNYPTEGPAVHFKSLSILNRPVHIGEKDSVHQVSLDRHIDYIKGIEFDYGHKEFTIGYGALQFYSPGSAVYRYRLKGFADDWLSGTSDSKVSFTNLDPGKYRFEVQASIIPGIWGPVRHLDISIRPPFWMTWWFITLVFIVISGLLYFLHYYRLQKALAIANLRNQIAQDLHDDIGSSLTKISLYSSLLSDTAEDSRSNGFLSNIGDLSRQVISQMSDIVWSVDQKNDTAGNMISRMQQFASETFEACNIQFNFETKGIQPSAFVDPLFRQNFYLIFKESVNNICKHSRATKVDVEVSSDQGRYALKVRDNGRGMMLEDGSRQNEFRVSSKEQKGNGLDNMRKRAERIGLHFMMVSVPEKGTTIEVG